VYGTGTPVIVSDIPTFRPYFNASNAFVFQPYSLESLVAALHRAWTDAPALRRFSSPGPRASPAPARPVTPVFREIAARAWPRGSDRYPNELAFLEESLLNIWGAIPEDTAQ
jgi:hypothetical protein